MHGTHEPWHLYWQRILVDLVAAIDFLSHRQRPVLSDIAAELVSQFREDGDGRLIRGQVEELGQAGEYRPLLRLLAAELCSILFRMLSGSLLLAHSLGRRRGGQPRAALSV